MLRNSLKFLVKNAYKQTNRNVCVSSYRYAKNSNSGLNRQSKIMGKLFGNRITGSKKRWYPDSGSHSDQHNNVFKAAHLSKPGGAGKNSTRRMAVLNKLFMEQISSLMAMGNVSEYVLGKGIQLTRVKIAPDFAFVNVYWMAKGDVEQDGLLINELKKCSGLLRHELSQLRVMGEVPRINFVHDRTFANVEQVNNLLRNMDLDCEEYEENSGFETDVSEDVNEGKESGTKSRIHENALIKEEFFGNVNTKANSTDANEKKDPVTADFLEKLPPMRHDVFGLDHRSIMAKITLKMKKSKMAWDTHHQRQATEGANESASSDESEGTRASNHRNTLANIQQRVQEANEKSVEFQRFLVQRKKNTPDRKKYNRDDNLLPHGYATLNDVPNDAVLSTQQRKMLNENDYLIDEHEKKT